MLAKMSLGAAAALCRPTSQRLNGRSDREWQPACCGRAAGLSVGAVAMITVANRD